MTPICSSFPFRGSALAVALLLAAVPSRGVAQVAALNGFYGGDRVLYVNAATVTLTSGSGVVDGNVFQNGPGNLQLVPPLAGHPSANFYCYVQNTLVVGFNPNFNPPNFTFLCVNGVSPLPDGHPPVAITAGGYGANASALFVGSFVTSAAVTVVPFYRNGEQVIWTPQNIDAPGAIDSGLLSAAGAFVPGAAWAWQAFALNGAPFPSSASAAIIELFASSSDTHLHNLCFLDPNQRPAVGNPVKTCQGQLMVDAISGAGHPAEAGYRIEANVNNAGNVWLGTDTSLLTPGINLNYQLVLRGYVEPVNHLLPR
jgi:hypothetical protein